MDLLKLFADNLLPVFLAALGGYLLGARGRVDPAPIARMAFSLLSPCLVYEMIVKNRLAVSSMLEMGAFVVITLLAMGIIAGLTARLFRWSRPISAGFVLAVMLPNAGNFGLAANLFAFGEEGLAQASMFFVVSAVMSYTVGVLVASLGRAGLKESLLGLVRVPAIWAVPVAFLVIGAGYEPPLALQRAITLFSDASIPVFLVVLGMQLRGATWRGHLAPLLAATALRLVGALLVALMVARLLGLEGAAWQAAIFQASMPSAVITIILATQYRAEPAFVTSVVTLTTLLCPLTLTPLLKWLGAGS
jgi:malate permease and related proteins